MPALWKSCLVFAVFAVASSGTTFAQQTRLSSALQLLNSKYAKMTDYESDFVEFAKVVKNNELEFEIATQFIEAASHSEDRLDAAKSLLLVYANLTCETDRAAVRSLIQTKLNEYADAIDRTSGELNLGIAHTHNSGLAATGTRFKEELRDTRNLLRSISLN